MIRARSLIALAAVCLAMGTQVYAGNPQAARDTVNVGSERLQGDNCSIDSYPWLSSDRQSSKG